MSAEQMQALLARAAEDPSTRKRFSAAASPEEAVAIANDLGFAVTVQDLQPGTTDELSDAELEAAVGGVGFHIFTMECWTKSFNC